MPGHRWLREACTPARKTRENTVKKIFAALAVLGFVLGTTTLITPAHAAYYSSWTQGNNQGGGG
jgi:hypothetical protein